MTDTPAEELERLRSWKASAMTLLTEWDLVHDALGSPGPLGGSKAFASLAEVERLVAFEAETKAADR